MLAVIDEAIRDPRGCCVAAMLCGHVHVDRLNGRGPVPSLLVNSASYHWDGEMVPYRDPLYAFITLTTDGWCRIEGRPGDWATPRRAAQIDPDRLGVRPAITSRSVRTSAMG